MKSVACLFVVAVLAVMLGARTADAEIIIVNNDDPGEGFNDPSARAAVGGNTETTLGAQRLAVFEHAADLMEQVISSSVDIRVEASFDPLFCDATSATLGSAGALNFFRNFSGTLAADTWFPSALANKLAGFDQAPDDNDISAQFNSAVGTTCPFPNVFYYGLDGNAGVSEIDLVTVVLHELGHGLGFATIVTLASGAKGLGTGFDDAFMLFLENHDTSELYPDMTDEERVTASTATGSLHWVGSSVVDGSTGLVSGRDAESGHVQMFAPDPQQPGSSVSHWDSALSPDELMEPSYTGPLQDVGLMAELFDDIGWNTSGASTTTTSPSTTTTTTTTTTSTTIPSTTTTGSLPTTTSTTTTSTTTTTTTTTTTSTTTTTVPVTTTLAPTTTTEPATTTTTLESTTTLPATTTTTLESTTTLPATTSTTTEPSTTTTVPDAPLCGDFSNDGEITAPDALAILRAAVDLESCAPCVCDVTDSNGITATDALATLQNAVGTPGADLNCPAC
jgi:hypothetical protein